MIEQRRVCKDGWLLAAPWMSLTRCGLVMVMVMVVVMVVVVVVVVVEVVA